MEHNPFHGHINSKVADALEEIGFKRDKHLGLGNHWHRWSWRRPLSQELIILGLAGEWMYDNGRGTRFWSSCYDNLFDCIAKGWV